MTSLSLEEAVTEFLGIIVNMDSYNEDEVLGKFETLMDSVLEKISDKNNLSSRVMNLIESQIILNPEINDQRRLFIMKCFTHFNDHMFEILKTKVKNARKYDLYPPINVMNQQLLYNTAYKDSIQQEKLTDDFLELLETYKKHDSKLIEEYKKRHIYQPMVKRWIEEDTQMNQVDGGRRKKSKKNIHYKKHKSKSKYKHRSTKKLRKKSKKC
jgi:hypothetical protein